MRDNSILYWTAIAIAVFANVLTNSLLKISVSRIGEGTIVEKVLHLFQTGIFWGGVVAAGFLFAAFLVAIKFGPVSVTYIAVTSLAATGLVAIDRIYFGMPLTLPKIIALLLIVSGFSLLAWSSNADTAL